MTSLNSEDAAEDFDAYFDEMMAECERNMTAWDRVNRRFRRHVRRIRDGRRQVRWAYQRVTRGWDDLAAWSVKDSLSKTLGEQLVDMANISHGYPPFYPDRPGLGGPQTFLPDRGDEVHERWMSDLREHGEALLAYSRDEDDDLATYGAAQDALRWVADNLGDLWD